MASIRKRRWPGPDGNEKCAWVVDWADQFNERHRRQFETKGEATNFRITVEGQIANGTFRSGGDKTTFGELAEKFLIYAAGRRDRGERMTRGSYGCLRGHIENYLCPSIGLAKSRTQTTPAKAFKRGLEHLKLTQLTVSEVHDFRDRLREVGVSVPTTRSILTTLHTVLEYGKARNMLTVNPAYRIPVIGPRNEVPRKLHLHPRKRC